MSTLSEKDKQLKQWMEEIGVDPIPDLKIDCIACNTKIQVDKTLNAPIGGINLISFAGPLSKYRDNSMYSTYNDKLHFLYAMIASKRILNQAWILKRCQTVNMSKETT